MYVKYIWYLNKCCCIISNGYNISINDFISIFLDFWPNSLSLYFLTNNYILFVWSKYEIKQSNIYYCEFAKLRLKTLDIIRYHIASSVSALIHVLWTGLEQLKARAVSPSGLIFLCLSRRQGGVLHSNLKSIIPIYLCTKLTLVCEIKIE